MATTNPTHSCEQACALAAMRGVRCYAMVAERCALPKDPCDLVGDLRPPRHLLWRGSNWLLVHGAAASLRVSGPGRATRLAAAFAKLGERCCCSGDIDLPLATLALSFEAQAPGSGAWGSDLPGAEAILPARAWLRRGRTGWFCRCAAVDPGDSPQQVLARMELLKHDLPDPPLAAGGDWRPLPDHSFQDLVREAVALVHHGALRKVVLARAVDIPLLQAGQAQNLLPRLRALADADTTVYWYDLSGDTSFIGATPETLFRVEDGHLHTMALAGSRRRDSDPQADRDLARDLLSSTKERKEHNLVLEHVLRVLEHRVGDMDIPAAPRLRRLATVQHLQTDLTAPLVASDPFDLLAQLHPTPAVCGLPTALAADHIRRHEGLQRGLYSGVLGWLTPSACHLVVPLRGGIIGTQRARLFAGAGIVESSDPQAEELETDAKLSVMRQVLAVG